MVWFNYSIRTVRSLFGEANQATRQGTFVRHDESTN